MKTLTIALPVLVLALLLPACRPAGSAPDTGEKPKDAAWTPPETTEKAPDQGSAPEPPRSVANHAAEWLEIGLTEEQIRAKITDGIENSHLGSATAMTDAEKEMLKKAGATDELVKFLSELDLPEAGAPAPEAPAPEKKEGDQAPAKAPAKAPEEAAPAAP